MRCPRPKFLKWSSAESACPETAEVIEADAEQDAKNETHSMVADCVKTKSPIVEEETADDALQEIVGKTHLAYALKVGDGFTHPCGVI